MNFKLAKSFALAALINFIGITSHAQTLVPKSTDTKNLKLLNGKWKFKYLPSKHLKNDSLFFKPEFDANKWSLINTPGNWEMQDFAEPIYGKKTAEGTGLYRTTFNIPQDWIGSSIHIAFGGVQSSYSLWVNGKIVGNFDSSFNLKTFDVSKYIKTGENILAVQVYTKPKGWEFDTNDDWSLHGIFRDVSLFSLPQTHINDITIKTYVKENTSRLNINTKIINPKSNKNLNLISELFDDNGKLIKTTNNKIINTSKNSNYTNLEHEILLQNPKLWNAETPNLYTLKVSLKEKDKTLQTHTEKIGIREITWNNGILKINGSPVKLRGINHHNLSPINGRAITEAEMLKDLDLLVKGNINCIRTAHYPPQPRLIELCDSLGIYVLNEIPYGYGDELLNDSSYLPLLKERAKATIWRDKNRPSVILWTVGNENPVTEIGLLTGKYVKQLDETRPYAFPQTPTVFNNMFKQLPDSLDILDFHYPRYEELKQLAPKLNHPLIAGEYAHALGLDFGSVEDIFEVMYTEPKLAGGAVWKLFDQGIIRKTKKLESKNESTVYAWINEDTIYDTGGNQGTDGIVYADRTPQTDFFQLRKVYSPVKINNNNLTYKSGKNTYNLEIQNRHDFLNLSDLNTTWYLFSNKKIIQSGNLNLLAKPHETITAALELNLPENTIKDIYYIKVVVKNKNLQIYEKTIELNTSNIINQTHLTKNLKITESTLKNNLISNQNFQLKFNPTSGNIILNNSKGNLLISEGMFARVGRKPSVAQNATTSSKRSKTRATIWNPFILTQPTVELKKFNTSELTANYTFKPDSLENRSISGEIKYQFNNNGIINVNYYFTATGNDNATETGLSFIIPNNYTEFRWIGNGPYPAYPGKQQLSDFGIFHLNSKDLYFSGNRQNVSCAIFSDKNGNGLIMLTDKANIAFERDAKGIIISHNSYVSSTFNKYEWPKDIYRYSETDKIQGDFKLIPFCKETWPKILTDIFGSSDTTTLPFQPFYHSYDQ